MFPQPLGRNIFQTTFSTPICGSKIPAASEQKNRSLANYHIALVKAAFVQRRNMAVEKHAVGYADS